MKCLILLILIYLKTSASLAHEDEIRMFVGFIANSHEKPLGISALLCWDKNDKAALMGHLQNLKPLRTVRFVKESHNISAGEPMDVITVTDLLCPDIDNVLQEAESTNMFSNPHRWIIFGQKPDNGQILPLQFERINIPLNSEVFLALKTGKGHFEIHLIYKICKNDEWLTEYYGTWLSSSGLQLSSLFMTPTTLRRRNLARALVTVTFNVDDKKEIFKYATTKYDYKIENSFHSVTQWGFRNVQALFQFMNATRLNRFSDGWGYFINGSWNGIVGDMDRGDADLAGTAVFMTTDRLKQISYLTDTIQTSVKFVFREPPLSYQNNLFLLPFNAAVWNSLLGFVLLMMVVIYVNARWERKKYGTLDSGEENDITGDTKISISDIAMIIVGAVSQQGSSVQFRDSIGRLVIFTLFFMFLFLFTAYSASIVVLLQASSKQIRTLSDLLNSRLELGVENTSYNIHYFTTATDPVRKAIYETKVAPKGKTSKFMSLRDGIKKLQKHPFAFNMDIGVGYRVVQNLFFEHEKCGLQEIAFIPTSRPWLTCKKTSPYAELYKIGMYRLREHGISDQINSFVFSRRPVCSVSGSSFASVNFIDVCPAMLILLYGILLASVLLALEIIVQRRWLAKKTARNIDI